MILAVQEPSKAVAYLQCRWRTGERLPYPKMLCCDPCSMRLPAAFNLLRRQLRRYNYALDWTRFSPPLGTGTASATYNHVVGCRCRSSFVRVNRIYLARFFRILQTCLDTYTRENRSSIGGDCRCQMDGRRIAHKQRHPLERLTYGFVAMKHSDVELERTRTARVSESSFRCDRRIPWPTVFAVRLTRNDKQWSMLIRGRELLG